MGNMNKNAGPGLCWTLQSEDTDPESLETRGGHLELTPPSPSHLILSFSLAGQLCLALSSLYALLFYLKHFSFPFWKFYFHFTLQAFPKEDGLDWVCRISVSQSPKSWVWWWGIIIGYLAAFTYVSSLFYFSPISLTCALRLLCSPLPLPIIQY